MNVAIATWAAPGASAVMTARSGGSTADEGAGTGTLASASTASGGTVPTTPAVPPAAAETPSPAGTNGSGTGEGGQDDPLVNRYPRIGVSFNSEASRLIILFRDPATGQAIDQIPSEVALKQYIDAQQKEKATATPRYDTVVGGTQTGGQTGPGDAATAAGGSTGPSGNAGDSAGAGRAAAGGTHTASLRLAAVNGSLPAAGGTPAPAVRVQAPAGRAVHSGTSSGLNLTI